MQWWGNKASGFTIVELIIVITTIGIIAGIVTIGYGAVINNGHDTAIKADLKKLADSVTLSALDNGSIPSAGAIWNGGTATGNSTILPGISFAPAKVSYYTDHTNLYYCVGDVNGAEEFAVMARSTSGNSFAYRSDSGLVQLSGVNVGESSNPLVNCGAVDMSEPVGWSYGYNPSPQYLWFSWADADAAIIANLVLNPKGFGSTAGWFSPIVPNVTATSGESWNGKNDWYRYVWNGTGFSTVRLNVNLADLTDGLEYTASILVGNSGATTVSWTMDFADAGQTNYSLAAGESTRVYLTTSRSTYDSTFRFFDFNLTSSNATGLLVSEALVTEGSTQYLYRDGYSVGWSWSGTANASTSSGPGAELTP